MFGLQHSVEKAARKAGAFSIGGLLAAIGVGFLTVAAWILLADLRSPLFAASMIGFVYVSFSLIAFGAAIWGGREPREVGHQGGLSPMQTVAVSFIQGLEQGRQMRR